MSTSKPISCGRCREKKVLNNAIIWCYNCDEGLCCMCSGHHKRSQISRYHKTIDIKKYKLSIKTAITEYEKQSSSSQSNVGIESLTSAVERKNIIRCIKSVEKDINSISAVKTECLKHNQQLKLYCPSHLMPCCDECIFKSHSRCKGIESLASVVEKTNIETYKEFVNKNINSILHHLDELTNNKSPNIKLGENQCEDIKESQVEVKKKINTRFDFLEKKVFGEKDIIFDKEKSKALFLINEIEGKKKRLKEIQDNLNAITTLRKQESFLGVHIIEQQLPPLQRYIENLDDNEIFNTLNKFRSLKSFEEEAIDKTLNKETSMRREAQVETQEIKYMTVNIESKNEINTGMVIRDMICLIDGRVVLVQWFGNVYLLTSDCSLVTKIPINGKACCVTQINLNTIAISYPNQKAIAIFELENETITKVIIFEKHCYGLSFCDNYLAVCLGNNDICITDLVGNILSSIQVHSESLLWNLVYRNDVLIYSDCSGKAVYCIDLSGKQLWEYKQELVKPAGICTDNYGNIFIADEGSHRITVISQDGHHSKVLVSEEDGLDYPRFICFEYNESSGFICDCNGEYLATFNLSYA